MRPRLLAVLSICCVYAVAPAVLLLHDPAQAFSIRALVVLAVVLGGISERYERATPTVNTFWVATASVISFMAAGVMLFAAFILKGDAPHRPRIILLASIVSATAMLVSMLVEWRTSRWDLPH